MMNVALGARDEDTLTSLASRIIRLNSQMTASERKAFTETVGIPAGNLAEKLLDAFDEDIITARAQAQFGCEVPTPEQYAQVQKESITDAVKPFHNPEVRDFIENIRRSHEQIIDEVNIDEVIFAGFDHTQEAHADMVIASFRAFIEEYRDEIIGMQLVYQQAYRDRPMVLSKLRELYEKLKARGVNIPIRHLDNSAGLMNFDCHYEMVRSGIVTYGMYPSDEVAPELLELKPALQWLSRVTHVKVLPAGREVSYGGTYVTTHPTRIATVPVGYADGYRRNLSGKFHVLIHGKKAPILGRICMDQLMVDVTDIPETQVNDRVTLVGQDGEEEITMEAISAAADSFNYEFVCGISRRVPRLYCREGKTIHSVHYLLDD